MGGSEREAAHPTSTALAVCVVRGDCELGPLALAHLGNALIPALQLCPHQTQQVTEMQASRCRQACAFVQVKRGLIALTLLEKPHLDDLASSQLEGEGLPAVTAAVKLQITKAL